MSDVTIVGGGRRSELTISFGSTRASWTVRKLQSSVAAWAKDVILEEKSAQDKRALPEFKGPISLTDLSNNCSRILSERNGHAAVDLVDLILAQAVLHGASDVHFDPFSDCILVRFRQDGVLQDIVRLDNAVKPRLTSRLKVISRLATFKNAVAQEGRARLAIGGRTVDFRFSSIPTIHGEKVSVRVFDPAKSIFDIDKLGMSSDDLSSFKAMLMQPQGTILLTGPAGSGKTTTMYAALTYLRENKKNLSSLATVEDPVEYDLRVVNQTQVNNISGLTFANALRTVLRQDPEVIMIGEIRDQETADIATQAGLTGHMVLSTVHARSAAGVLLRMVDLGVEPYLVASSVTAILSQRLVRTVCPSCARDYTPTPEEIAKFGLTGSEKLRAGKGCDQCGDSGYAGRTGIFQLAPVSDDIRELVLRRTSVNELDRQMEKEQIGTLVQDGLQKAKLGITTLEELSRVLG